MDKNCTSIEYVDAGSLPEVLPLIRAYQVFYQVPEINDEKNRAFFSQFGQGQPQGCQLLARWGDRVVGFATVYFSFSSTIAEKVAVLNDLYILPELRRLGVGRSLIEAAREYAAEQSAVRLQWLTAKDNLSAQALYDTMDTQRSEWQFYTYPVKPKAVL